uniref:CSON010203 protein n=1 Tax=Culicoides sonorensis TaxID=179676 RepID=A0A336MZ43_CULSO
MNDVDCFKYIKCNDELRTVQCDVNENVFGLEKYDDDYNIIEKLIELERGISYYCLAVKSSKINKKALVYLTIE